MMVHQQASSELCLTNEVVGPFESDVLEQRRRKLEEHRPRGLEMDNHIISYLVSGKGQPVKRIIKTLICSQIVFKPLLLFHCVHTMIGVQSCSYITPNINLEIRLLR